MEGKKGVMTSHGQVLSASDLEIQVLSCSSLLVFLAYATGMSLYPIHYLHSSFEGTGIHQQK